MIGCLVVWKCLVACLFFESSQHPTCPQVRQRRRCTQVSPVFKQSSQPFALGVTCRIWSRWVHCVAKIVSFPMFSDAFCQIGASCLDGRSSQARLRLPPNDCAWLDTQS